MKKRIVVISLVLLWCTKGMPAWAQIHRDVPAAHISAFDVEVLTGNTIVISTSNLSAGCDTVLHLLDAASHGEVAQNDDADNTSLASKFTFTNANPFQTQFKLVVRASSESTWGTADVTIGTQTEQGVNIRGAFLPGQGGGFPQTWVYETVLATNGAVNPVMYALDSAGRIFVFDDDSGVGLNARIVGTLSVSSLLIGTASNTSTEGPVHVFANDTWLLGDSDFDGLGDNLERALGTCPGIPPPPGQEFPCEGVFNPQDTDHDGISDYIEVFGIDDPVEPQHLSRWGANPLRKDVFVEVDFTADAGPNALTGAEAATVQQVFALAPANDILNPDGSSGIFIHIDNGIDPATPNLATLHGKWGGSNEASGSYKTAPETFRAPVRAGIFHYALASGGGGGQAWAYGDRLTFGGSAGLFCHELGHNLGLQHHGHSEFGRYNGKPNYLSLMNYAYEARTNIGFSDGSRRLALNPSNASEGVGIGVNIPDLPADSLGGGTLRRTLVPPMGVDFDFDSRIVNRIRAPLTFLVRGTGGEPFVHRAQLITTAPMRDTTPVVLRAFGDRLFVFFVDGDGVLQYSTAETSGPDESGSCPGGDGEGEACCQWMPPQVLKTNERVVSLAAAVFQKQLAVVYRTTSNELRFFAIQGFSAGQLGNASPEQPIDGVVSIKEPHLTPMHINPDFFDSAETALGLFVLDEDRRYRWLTTTELTEPFVLQDSTFPNDGRPLEGNHGPTFTTWPHFDPEQAEPSETVGVASDRNDRLHIFRYNKNSNTWANRSSVLFRDTPTTTTKPGLAFHVLRRSTGDPIIVGADEVPNGQLWLSTTEWDGSKNDIANVWISSLLTFDDDPTTVDFAPLFQRDREGWFGNMWSANAPGTGTWLYEDMRLSALKAARITFSKRQERLQFFPFADGSFDAQLRDVNDWQVMERGIGVSIAGEGFCGTAEQSRWGL